MDKALSDFKDTMRIYKLEEMTEHYQDILRDVELWSSEFKSGEPPKQKEIAYFFSWYSFNFVLKRKQILNPYYILIFSDLNIDLLDLSERLGSNNFYNPGRGSSMWGLVGLAASVYSDVALWLRMIGEDGSPLPSARLVS